MPPASIGLGNPHAPSRHRPSARRGRRHGPRLAGRPDADGSGGRQDDAAGRLPCEPLRRRTGRHQADRHDARRPRPALGGRIALLSPLEDRRHGRRRPHPHLRGPQRNRPFRLLQGLLRPRPRTCPASPSVSAASGSARRRTCSSFPLKPNGDEPAGPPRVVLDGWDLKAKHNVFNQLVWGPDGWLYGCNGILSNSHVGKPGTPDADRVALNCGVWRYHPVTEKFEVVRPGHDESVGPRLRRPRRGVHHQLRHQAPVPRRPRRPLPAHVRPGPERRTVTA